MKASAFNFKSKYIHFTCLNFHAAMVHQ